MDKLIFRISLALIFIIPWELMVNVPLLGTLTRITGVLLALYWVVAGLESQSFRKPEPFHIAVFFFFLWNAASFFWSVDQDATITRIGSLMQNMILLLIIWDVYRTKDAVRAGLQAYVLGATVSALAVMMNFSAGIDYYSLRYSATGFNANALATILSLAIPIAWYLTLPDSESRLKWPAVLTLANYAYLPIGTIAIALTGSRTGMLGLAVALFYMLRSLGRLKPSARVVLFAFVVASAFLVQSYVPQSSFDRWGTTFSELDSGDLNGRLQIWEESIDVFLENPVIGVGVAAHRTATDIGKVAHNAFLSVPAELGVIGLLLFAVVLIISVRRARSQVSSEDEKFWTAMLIMLAIGSAAHNFESKKFTWLILGFVVVSANLAYSHAGISPRSNRYRALQKSRSFRPNESTDDADGHLVSSERWVPGVVAGRHSGLGGATRRKK